MPQLTSCPSTIQLQHYLQGQIPDTAAAAIDAHLQECAQCVQALGGVTLLPQGDPLLEAVEASGGLRRPRNPFIDGLVKKLEDLSLTMLPQRLAAHKDAPSQSVPAGETISNVASMSALATTTNAGGIEMGSRAPDDPQDCLAPAEAPDEMGRSAAIAS